MGILDRFIETGNNLDIRKLISPDVEALDSLIPPTSLFKYFPNTREDFFREPSVRFTQKTALNDPFELTKRWREFASPATRKVFSDHLKERFAKLAANKGIVLELAREQFAKKGIFLGPDQVAEAARIFLSDQGRQHYDSVMNNVTGQIEALIEAEFRIMDIGIDEQFQKLISQIGIFSLSEILTSPQMWALYATSGKGFAIEFNTAHEFFKAETGNNLLQKVLYPRAKLQDFWQNPYSLFLTKDAQWSFEREWRMIRNLATCDKVKKVGDEEIYLCRVRPGMIKSVTFGYAYDQEKLAKDGAWLRIFDPSIQIAVAKPNSSTQEIDVHALL